MRLKGIWLIAGGVLLVAATAAGATELPSWADGPVKTAILEWLAGATDPGSGDFVPQNERIAVFDHDGTSWCERPASVPREFQVSLARSMAALGKVDPDSMPFSAWFADDRDALREFGYGEAYRQMNMAFAGMPVTAYRDSARAWIARSVHEEYGVPFTDLYYQPMRELKNLLVANGFEVWMVTASAQDFVRAFVEEFFGIPPQRVIGTWTMPEYRDTDGKVEMIRGPEQSYNGHEHKPANIEMRIGRQPVFAAGNSNNDKDMCNWAVSGTHSGMAIWIHHDDGDREYDYDRGADRIRDLTRKNPDAHEVSMKNDWVRIYSEPRAKHR